MKPTWFAAAIFAAPLIQFAPQASAQSAPTPEFCQPLSATNLEACCAAENWRELILPGEIAFCPPLNAEDNDSGRTGQTLADTDPSVVDDPVDDETTGSIKANPGNAMEVGGAGEQGMDTESPVTGTKGDSN
jgi:hypothetical protein